jgi:tetratricopeptide (TPR) repeat protein
LEGRMMRVPTLGSYQGLLGFVFFAISLPSSGQDYAGQCGQLANHYGPYDYRTASDVTRKTVEDVHFTPKVESLAGGNTSITAGGDLNYTLRVFPNHHRALMAVVKLSEKEKSIRPRDMNYSVPCWFDRAERFRPDDAMVKALHGLYLSRTGKTQAAIDKLEEAKALAGDNANINYNLGLAYFDLKQYEKALGSAHAAYALGFPLPGLRDKLKRAGKWSEPMPVAVNLPKKPEIPAKAESIGNPSSETPIPNPEPVIAPSRTAN